MKIDTLKIGDPVLVKDAAGVRGGYVTSRNFRERSVMVRIYGIRGAIRIQQNQTGIDVASTAAIDEAFRQGQRAIHGNLALGDCPYLPVEVLLGDSWRKGWTSAWKCKAKERDRV